MAKLSVREAAYRVGVTRQTLFKYIRQGKVSATLGHDGLKQIDVTELIRVFGELHPDTVASGDGGDRRPLSPATANTTTATALQLELERMKAQLQFKEAELALAKERIDELKARELDAKHRERESTEERMRMLGVIETQNRLLAALPTTPKPRIVQEAVSTQVKPKTVDVAPMPVKASKKVTKSIKPKQESSKSLKAQSKKAKTNQKAR